MFDRFRFVFGSFLIVFGSILVLFEAMGNWRWNHTVGMKENFMTDHFMVLAQCSLEAVSYSRASGPKVSSTAKVNRPSLYHYKIALAM